ncbi:MULTISPECIES: transporter associated domain-containing protein [Sutcliffiella]|uniref:Transporter-associated domain-containing protein n=1 Tax=Sutcliffiella cohnii TaxID=33932 RepID=A0A223KK71_9BACI|nr:MULTISPECIES: transporter associated domain-containing protein [Sutcliffiella]AST89890.1 hypothetical protein BC6307_00660 [Sutcliffiella cohnii]WBL15513.1 hypothetical protein O1A01_02355 [Sutcliffiella sp. NC1]
MDSGQVKKIGQDLFVLSGMLNLHEVEDILKVEFPKDEYDTLSRFIIGQLCYSENYSKKENAK